MKLLANIILFIFIILPTYSICFAEDFWMHTVINDRTTKVFCTPQNEVIINTPTGTSISKDKGITWSLLHTKSTIFIDESGNYLYKTYWDSVFTAHKDTLEWKYRFNTSDIPIQAIYKHKNYYFISCYRKLIKVKDDWTEPKIVLEFNGGEDINTFQMDSVGTLYAGTTDFFNNGDPGGLYKSFDDGDTWTYPDLPNDFVWAMDIDSEGRIFVGTCGEYFEGEARVYRSIDNGNSWDILGVGLQAVSVEINSEDEIFIGFLDYDAIVFSQDHGDSWSYLREGYSGVDVYNMAVSNDGYVFVATDRGLFRSYKPTTAIKTQFVEVSSFINNTDVFGLTGTVDVELKNIGILPAESVSVKASTKSKFIALTDSTEFYGDLSEDQAVMIGRSISYVISTEVTETTTVKIDFEITDLSGEKYFDCIDLILEKPLLEFSNSISGNETIYPGDSRIVTIGLRNSSSADIDNIMTDLVETESSNISISDPVTVANIDAYSQRFVDYICAFSNLTPVPQDIKMRLNFQASEGISTFYDFILRVGITENFETGDLTMNDWKFAEDADWSIDETVSYEGRYSLKSGELDYRQTSSAYLDLNFLTDGFVSFYKKVTGPDDDDLDFIIDTVVMEWSGVIDWSYEIFPVKAGQHRIAWKYWRNSSYSGIGNNAWIDNILITGIATGIEENHETLSDKPFLSQNYPNPFNNSTQIQFSLEKVCDVVLNVFNSKGELVQNLVSRKLNKGKHNFSFKAVDINSGVYFYRLNIDGVTKETKKMLYLK